MNVDLCLLHCVHVNCCICSDVFVSFESLYAIVLFHVHVDGESKISKNYLTIFFFICAGKTKFHSVLNHFHKCTRENMSSKKSCMKLLTVFFGMLWKKMKQIPP